LLWLSRIIELPLGYLPPLYRSSFTHEAPGSVIASLHDAASLLPFQLGSPCAARRKPADISRCIETSDFKTFKHRGNYVYRHL
jgi:hypothetical protein